MDKSAVFPAILATLAVILVASSFMITCVVYPVVLYTIIACIFIAWLFFMFYGIFRDAR